MPAGLADGLEVGVLYRLDAGYAPGRHAMTSFGSPASRTREFGNCSDYERRVGCERGGDPGTYELFMTFLHPRRRGLPVFGGNPVQGPREPSIASQLGDPCPCGRDRAQGHAAPRRDSWEPAKAEACDRESQSEQAESGDKQTPVDASPFEGQIFRHDHA